MKKYLLAFSTTLCLLFSTAATNIVRADDGNGHAPGYICTATVDCPPTVAPPQSRQSSTPGSDSGAAASATPTAAELSSILLELIKALLPKI